MRNLYVVIGQILEVAPDLGDKGLRSIQDSVSYAAPEMMPMWWNETAFFLNEEADNHPKSNEIAKIFGGLEDEPAD